MSQRIGVGGSWIAPGDLLAEGDYVEIEARARFAASPLISLERLLKDLVVTCRESLAQIGRVLPFDLSHLHRI